MIIKLNSKILFIGCFLVLSVGSISTPSVADMDGPENLLTDPLEPGDMGGLPDESDLSGALSLPKEEAEIMDAYAHNLNTADLVSRLHIAHLKAIELAQLGEEKGHSPFIRVLSRRIRLDSSFADRHLLKLADAHNVAMPIALSADRGGHATTIQTLLSLGASGFDREFLKQVSANNEELTAIMESASSQIPLDSQFMGYVAVFSPVLNQHKAVAKNVMTKQLGVAKD